MVLEVLVFVIACARLLCLVSLSTSRFLVAGDGELVD